MLIQTTQVSQAHQIVKFVVSVHTPFWDTKPDFMFLKATVINLRLTIQIHKAYFLML